MWGPMLAFQLVRTFSLNIRGHQVSADRFAKIVFIGYFVFFGLYFVAGKLLGPGVGDFTESLANGYEYYYAGGNERMIVYTGNERPETIVIDARVDDYRVVGDRLLVVRRPREIYQDGDVTKSKLFLKCEYWVINTKIHKIEKTQRGSEFQDLVCSAL